MTRALCLGVLVILSGLSAACGAAPAREDDVVAPLQAFYAAMKTGDKAAAMAQIAPDAVFVESGKLETRTEYEMNHLPADIDFEKQITGKRSPWQITVNGDTAWGIASTEYQGTVDGRDLAFVSRQLAVVTRGEDGKWLIRSIHWSSMPL